MPGRILRAECDCGFERDLSPGATNGGGGHVIAYADDGTDLTTFDASVARKKKLVVL